jgi:signal peptidase I
MFNRGSRYSYADQKVKRHRKRWIILWVFLFFVVYTFFTSLIFSMRVLENDTMLPGLRAGDRFVFSSYRIHSLFAGLDSEALPFRRGNIVLVDRSFDKEQNFFFILADSVLRFFTAQRAGLDSGREQAYIKRVIGLPGDEVSMTNFVIRVKPAGNAYSFTESELWDKPYEPFIPSVPALWDSSLPFSGNMDSIILGEDECFVLSDDRSNTNDSRSWGPVPVRHIAGKLLFRYWPFSRFGSP